MLINVRFQATTFEIYVRKNGTETRLIPCQHHYHFAPYSYFIHRPSIFPHPIVQQPLVGQGILITEASRSHSDAHTYTHTHTHTHTRLDSSGRVARPTKRHLLGNTQHSQETHPCPRRVSNPQSYQASDRRPTPDSFADRRRYLILANDIAVE